MRLCIMRAEFDPFRKKELAAIVHHMFDIFHGDVLIGRSELVSQGDPPALPGWQYKFDNSGSRRGVPRSPIDEDPNREPPKHTKGIPSMDEYESLD